MTPLSHLECGPLLGIDPKTLRLWMRQAHLRFAPHPTDARLTCLTHQQVQQLAAQHARPLRLPTPPELPTSLPVAESAGALLPAPGSGSATSVEVAALAQHLAHLHRCLLTCQEHVTALVLEVARDRQRLGVLEALVQHRLSSAPLPPLVQHLVAEDLATARPSLGQHPLPTEVRARAQVTALIEDGTGGSSVLVCPQEGILPFAPGSPEWFDWLATLTSFRFMGRQGRFHAQRDTRGGQHTRGFRASRTIHQHVYRHSLETTDRLTLAALEQAAATLQVSGDAREVVELGHALTSSWFRIRAIGVGAHFRMELMRQECAC